MKDCESDNSVVVGLERLKDKALVTISEKSKIVSMHHIIQETGREIVRQESIEHPGRRSRLWDPNEICEVLNNDKGTEAIRSITADLSVIKKLKLSPHVFSKMTKLEFLYFDGEYEEEEEPSDILPQGLQSFPPHLRFVTWTSFPLKSLPEKFSTENLALLELKHSRVETLWYGVKNLINLKYVALMGSKFLKEVPDFSKATNLKILNLSHCFRLNNVHPSIFSLNKLVILDLTLCISLTNIARDIQLRSLCCLSLSQCINLWNQSEFRVNNALQSDESKLEELILIRGLFENLPSWIMNQTRLRHLDLRFCSNLKTLPELPSSIDTLLVEGCESLKTVVKKFKKNMKKVDFWNCMNLDESSLRNIALNAQINLMWYAYQHLSGTEEHDYVENYEDYKDNYASYQAMYVYPGSSVPKWLEYKTRNDDMTIDLTITQPTPSLGFIFCFILSKGVGLGQDTELIVTIFDGDQGGGHEKGSVKTYMKRSSIALNTNHVCLIYDQQCSHYLSSRVTQQKRYKFKATIREEVEILKDRPQVKLIGFGVSTVNPSTNEWNYLNI